MLGAEISRIVDLPYDVAHRITTAMRLGRTRENGLFDQLRQAAEDRLQPADDSLEQLDAVAQGQENICLNCVLVVQIDHADV